MLRHLYHSLIGQSWLRKMVLSTPLVRDIVWRFVAGEDLEAAVRVVRNLNARGIKGTISYVGTHLRQADQVTAATEATIESLARLRQEGLASHVSIKPTNLGLDINEGLCREQLDRIIAAARAAGNFVRIDMEESPYVDATLRLFEELRDRYGRDTTGVVIQSYLTQRRGDLDRVIAGGSQVRLVKGGYWEPADVTCRRKEDIDRRFRDDIERLLVGGHYPAFATHDVHAIDYARRRAAELGKGKGDFEFQMLYGVRPDLQDRLVADGYNVRCYVPYGRQWHAYALGCIRRAPAGFLNRLREKPCLGEG